MKRAIQSLMLLPLCACSSDFVEAAPPSTQTSSIETPDGEPTALELRAQGLEAELHAITNALAAQSFAVSEDLDALLDSIDLQRKSIRAQLESVRHADTSETEAVEARIETSLDELQTDIERAWDLLGS